MKKRDEEVKKPSGRGDISLKPQRLSFANGASGFSNKKSNNDDGLYYLISKIQFCYII